MLFTHCYAGEVGSVHDARVLRKSEVWQYMNEVDEKFPENTHILGDKAYPCLPQLMCPYKENRQLTNRQRNFNYRLSAARSTIERAFGLLKKRMRCLKFLDVKCIEWIPKYIIACCVLHNICLLQEDIINIDMENENVEEVDIELVIEEAERERSARGQAKRERITNQL